MPPFTTTLIILIIGATIGSFFILGVVKTIFGSMPSQAGMMGAGPYGPYYPRSGLGSVIGFILLIATAGVLFKMVIQPAFKKGGAAKISPAKIFDDAYAQLPNAKVEAPVHPSEEVETNLDVAEDYEYLASAAMTEQLDTPEPSAENQPTSSEYFSQTTNRVYLQLGSFSDMENLTRAKSQFETKKGKYNLLMQIDESGWNTSYKLVLGPFEDKAKARLYNQQNQLKGFVKDGTNEQILSFH